MRNRNLLAMLAIGAVAVGAVALSDPTVRASIPFLREECSIGLAGTAVAVTMAGPGAEVTCDGSLGQMGPAGGTWYRLDADEVPGPRVLICRRPAGGDPRTMVTVYDAGSLMTYGHDLCSGMD